VEAPGQPLCGGTQYLKEIPFKAKVIILKSYIKLILMIVQFDEYMFLENVKKT